MTAAKPYHKSLEEIAMLIITRPAKTAAGREIAARVLARVEAQIEASK